MLEQGNSSDLSHVLIVCSACKKSQKHYTNCFSIPDQSTKEYQNVWVSCTGNGTVL